VALVGIELAPRRQAGQAQQRGDRNGTEQRQRIEAPEDRARRAGQLGPERRGGPPLV
jgi:hypothetical protein